MVRKGSGEIILDEILFGGQDAAGNPRAYHKLVGFLFLRGFPRLTRVPVLLLIHPMKLEQLHLRIRKVGRWLSKFFGDLPAQVIALYFDLLNLAAAAWAKVLQMPC